MKTTTKLRIFGAAVLLFNLWFAGHYDVTGIPLILLTFGFAAVYEFFVVRPAAKKQAPPPPDA